MVRGRAEFQPVSMIEKQTVEQCSLADIENLGLVCTQSSKDFALLAAQSLQTCCKRSRTVTGNKLECQSVVPDDVTELRSVPLRELLHHFSFNRP